MPSYLSPGVYTREIDFSYYIKQISTSACGMIGISEKGPVNNPTLVTSWEQFTRKFGSYITDGYLAYAARSFFDNGGQVLYVNRVAHYTQASNPASCTAAKSTKNLMDRPSIYAQIETGVAGTNKILWKASTIGVAGNNVQIAMVKAGNNTPLSVTVAGQVVTVNLATDAAGNVTSTCVQVASKVNQTGAALALVGCTSGDAGVVTPIAATNLAGGRDPQGTIKVTAVSEGKWGDSIDVVAADSVRDPTTLFNITVRNRGEDVEVFRDMSMDPSSQSYVATVINGRSDYITVDDISATTTATDKRPVVSTITLAGGADGLAGIADTDYIGDAAADTGFYAFDNIDGLNILCVPGVTTPLVVTGGIAYAEGRKDVFFIAEAPISVNPQTAVAFRKGKTPYSHGAFNSSYGALYYPWIEAADPLTGKTKLIPPTGAVAGCIARSDEKTEVWYAPAGIDRGRVFNALSLAYKTSRGERDTLYSEGVNVIASFPDTGINIWGQKTLQAASSATDRVNVRRLMMYLEEAIGQSARFVIFEPNNPQTWRALIRLINPFLAGIKSRNGLYDYRVQCDEETNTPQMIDQNQLVCRVFVKPTKTAEFVELAFVLTATGTSFKEVF